MKPLRLFTMLWWMIANDKWTGIFLSRHLPKTKERKKLGIGLWDRHPAQFSFFSAGFEVTWLDLSADMLKIAEKRAASAKQRLILLKAICWICPKQGNTTLSQTGRTLVCYAGWGRGRDVFMRCIRPQWRWSIYLDVHSTYQVDEVFPAGSYQRKCGKILPCWHLWGRSLTPSCMSRDFLYRAMLDGLSRHEEVHEERTYEVLTWYLLNKLPNRWPWGLFHRKSAGFLSTEVGEHDHHRYYYELILFILT